jgi:hypothetical protein
VKVPFHGLGWLHPLAGKKAAARIAVIQLYVRIVV